MGHSPISWSPDGKYIAFAQGRTVNIIDANESSATSWYVETMEYDKSIHFLEWSPCGNFMIIADEFHTYLYLAHPGEFVTQLNCKPSPIQWTNNGKHLLMILYNEHINYRNMESFTKVTNYFNNKLTTFESALMLSIKNFTLSFYSSYLLNSYEDTIFKKLSKDDQETQKLLQQTLLDINVYRHDPNY